MTEQLDLFDSEMLDSAPETAPDGAGGTHTPPPALPRTVRRPRDAEPVIPARCPVLGFNRCLRRDCYRWSADSGCTHPDARPKRRKRRVLLHLTDAGYVDGVGDAACWRCVRCGHETDWIPAPTKARPPCPRCNATGTAGDG